MKEKNEIESVEVVGTEGNWETGIKPYLKENTNSLTIMPKSGRFVLPSYALAYDKNSKKLKELCFDGEISYCVIGEGALKEHPGLESVTFPKEARNVYIHDNAFEGCSNLNSVNLPEGSSVGNGAFANCSAIKTMRFPNGLNQLNYRMCEGCTGLEQVDLR